jgi:hypothetical protein
MHTRTTVSLVVALALPVSGCRDVTDARQSLIAGPQLLALEAEPAEAAPGERVHYQALAVDADGPLEDPQLAFSFCRTPKPLGDNRAASDACAQQAEQAFAAQGTSADAAVPTDACTLFGPSVPANARPPDPDASGGYYQPLRIQLDQLSAVALQRIRCPLPNAPIAAARAFRERYLPNRNPVLTPLSLQFDGRELAQDRVPRGREIVLRVGWTAESAEQFVVYDRASAELVGQRESMRVSWYVNGGELAYDRTGRAATDEGLVTENRLRLPDRVGRAQLWIVLRDSRGGVTHASYDLALR